MNSSITETTLNFLIISVIVEIISNLTFISGILEIIINFNFIFNIAEKKRELSCSHFILLVLSAASMDAMLSVLDID